MKSLIILLLAFFLHPKIAFSQIIPPPTGSPSSCLITEFQRPKLNSICTDCLLINKPDIRQKYDNAQNTSCSNIVIYNHWCNGGLGTNESNACNGIKNGICSQAPGKPCVIPTVPPGTRSSPTPTPPATVNTATNPRGCGILYTSGVPSCWCNNGGGQGLCGKLPLDGIGGCRDLCEKGEFVGPKGYTLCFMMPNNSECKSNDDGSYRFCQKRCLPGSPGYSQEVGCQYPNNTVFSLAKFDAGCILTFNNSSNFNFFKIIDNFFKGIIRLVDINNFMNSIVRVPGLQKAACNPYKENCTFE